MSRLAPNHPTAVVYLDETGRVGQAGPFGVGCLKVRQHDELIRDLRALRQKQQVFAELQWKNLDTDKAPSPYVSVVETMVRRVARAETAQFAAVFTDGSEANLVRRYGDKWKAYDEMATACLETLIGDDEIVSVLADRYTPARHLGFEKTVTETVNGGRDRLAVTSVVRLKSSAADGLQLVDVLLGAVGYDFRKPGGGGGDKERVAQAVRDVHEVTSYRPNGRSSPGWFSVVYVGAPGTRGGRRRASR